MGLEEEPCHGLKVKDSSNNLKRKKSGTKCFPDVTLRPTVVLSRMQYLPCNQRKPEVAQHPNSEPPNKEYTTH
eukprot:4890413-Amphidinium_carterae.1